MIYLSLYETVSLKRCVMNNIKFLLLGTSLSFLPLTVNAQCVATQDCATLGYTETSCNGGKGVKCPFGNKWACLGANEEECEKSFCNKYGFTLTCTGTGYAGGAGQACNGKYISCTCASGYEWKDGNCQKAILNGPDGNVYKCNGSVVAVKTSGMNFYVAMRDLGYMYWDDADSGCKNYNFCNNNKGTLPSTDQLFTMYNNKSALNNLLSANGGIKLTENGVYWSSTRGNCNYYCSVSMANGKEYSTVPSDRPYVRPILTSW